MVSKAYHLKDSETFTLKALHWANLFDTVCFLDSNEYQDNYGRLYAFIAVGEERAFLATPEQGQTPVASSTFEQLQEFVNAHPNSWIPGFLSYDLKNEVEDLTTREPNRTGMPDAYFFVPRFTLLIGKYNVEIRAQDPDRAIREIEATIIPEDASIEFSGKIQQRMPKPAYMEAFHRIQEHLRRGDCYEVNLCQEFYAEEAALNPLVLYQRLNELSPTPFSCFFKVGDQYIISASPERFLSRQDNMLLSQPIKGTAPRGKDAQEDQRLKSDLENNDKEISENIMIVDLVRNDLTKCALPGTVRAPEIAKAYSFKQVHQLISTITCQVDPKLPSTQAIAHAFPPGSMTGAPKVSAMKLIDRYENSRRGVYSGALGYFSPQGNFDFSVVIRTILYHAERKYLSFHTGGAITLASDGEKEYLECLLKGKAIFEVLKSQ